jgi:hypothetical protein
MAAQNTQSKAPVQPVYQAPAAAPQTPTAKKAPMPAPQQTPPAKPDVQPNPPAPKRKGLPKSLLFIVVIIIFLGLAAVAFSMVRNRINNEGEEATATPGPAEHVFEEYPDFTGIPINDNTISFTKADGKFCLLYKNKIYLPQETGSLEPRIKDATEEMLAFPWIGLVDAPENITIFGGPGDEVFSFKESPSNKSFVFIVRWTYENGERFHMFRFNNDNLSELRVFDEPTDGLFSTPKVNLFSPGGNFLNLTMLRCAKCLEEKPETLLYYIPTAETRNIGKVSEFSWGEDDNTYSYRQYQEGVDPNSFPLRTNEFFEQSIDLLTP